MMLVKVYTGLLREFRHTMYSVCVVLKVERDEVGNLVLTAGGFRKDEFFSMKVYELKDLKVGPGVVKVGTKIMPLPPEYLGYTEEILKYYREIPFEMEVTHEQVSLHG